MESVPFFGTGWEEVGGTARALDLELEDPWKFKDLLCHQPSHLILSKPLYLYEVLFPHLLLGTVLPASPTYRLIVRIKRECQWNHFEMLTCYYSIWLWWQIKLIWVFLCLMSMQEYFQRGFCFPVFNFQGHSLPLTFVWERSSHTKGVSCHCGQGFKQPCHSLRL